MLSDAEISAQARKFWDKLLVDLLAEQAVRIRKTAPQRGMAPVPWPNLSLKLPPEISKHFSIPDYEIFFAADSVDDTPAGSWRLIRECRSIIIERQKKLRRTLPGCIKSLQGIISSELLVLPGSRYQDEVERSIANLQELQKFSGALIDYLENGWPASLQLSSNLDKHPRKQYVWRDLVLGLADKWSDRFENEHKMHLHIAEMMCAAFPSIWVNKDKTANSVRRHIEESTP